jgi:hypothetical protein
MQIGAFWRGDLLPIIGTGKSGEKGEVTMVDPATIAGGAAAIDELLLSPDVEERIALPKMSDLSSRRINSLDSREVGLHLADVGRNHEQLLDEFKSRFSQQLNERGIDREQEIRLTVAGDGQVIVANGHTQRAEIEQIFRDQPRLRDQFAEISGQASLLRAAKEAVEFQQAYRKNPIQALQEFRFLFERSGQPMYSMSIAGEAFSDLFA